MNSLFSFEGRINRSTWWIIYICNGVFGVLVYLILLLPMQGVEILLFGILSLLSLLIGIAAAVKRFHDTDRSGWCVLLILIPIFNIFYGIIVLGCLKGTEGENRFG